jgi:hypothetical protein
MAAMLTYFPRRAILEVATPGELLRLPVVYDPARVTVWERGFEPRSGAISLWDHCFELPGPRAHVSYRIAAGPSAADVYDFPGVWAARYDGLNTGSKATSIPGGTAAPHSHRGPAMYVGSRAAGIYVHGAPLCGTPTCVVLEKQWESLQRAIAAEPRLSFSVCF